MCTSPHAHAHAHGARRNTLQLCALRSFSLFRVADRYLIPCFVCSIPNSVLRVQQCVGRNVALVTETVFVRAVCTSRWSWFLVAASRCLDAKESPPKEAAKLKNPCLHRQEGSMKAVRRKQAHGPWQRKDGFY